MIFFWNNAPQNPAQSQRPLPDRAGLRHLSHSLSKKIMVSNTSTAKISSPAG